MNICLFPGTFDPVTLGHIDIILRAKPLFKTIIIGVGRNSAKTPMFSAEQRLQWFEDIFKDEPGITAAIYEGLTINFCKEVGARFILRGIRYVSAVSYTHLRAHETGRNLVCRLLLEKKKK